MTHFTAPRRRAAGPIALLFVLAIVASGPGSAAPLHSGTPAPPTTACPAGPARVAVIAFSPQAGFDTVGAVTVLLRYPADRLMLPGSGSEASVRARVTPNRSSAQLFVNDLGDAVRIAVVSAEGLPAGPLAQVVFDTCEDSPAPVTDDVRCEIESCSSGGGKLTTCMCSATLR